MGFVKAIGRGMPKKTAMLLLGLFVFSSLINGCARDEQPAREVLARINDFSLTLDEFQVRLAEELEIDSSMKLTLETRIAFLEECIRRELMLQEAKRLGLDRQESFVRAMERHWESTLIRDLLVHRNQEIEKRALVSEEEIAHRRAEILPLHTGETLPADLDARIEKEIRETKKTRMLQEWVDSLRRNGDVTITRELLKKP